MTLILESIVRLLLVIYLSVFIVFAVSVYLYGLDDDAIKFLLGGIATVEVMFFVLFGSCNTICIYKFIKSKI